MVFTQIDMKVGGDVVPRRCVQDLTYDCNPILSISFFF